MGFSYGTNPLTGRRCLCCDFCDHCPGETGHNGERIFEVKKVACPYGYCQHWATCDQCKKQGRHKISSLSFSEDKEENKRLRTGHLGCKLAAQVSKKQEEEKAQILAAGKFLRCAAYAPGDKVKVLFRDGQMIEKAYFMDHKTYDSIPLLTNATIEDYEKFGSLVPALNTNLLDAEVNKIE